jgi:methylmalonyl-CoA mutase
MQSLREPTMNMIRATSATFAAAVGGADSITVLPPFSDAIAFSDRMARNAQTVLSEESSVGRVSDPGAGAGAIDALTGELAEAAWDRFRQIEAEGGLAAALRSGSVQRAVAAIREERLARVARRAIAVVGVNVHVDRTAPLPAPAVLRKTESGRTDVEPLRAIRLSEPLEALWARAAPAGGQQATAMLIPLGAIHGEELSAAADAFAAGGFDAIVHDGGEAGLAEALRRRKTRVACVLADATAFERATGVTAVLREAGACAVVAAGPLARVAGADRFDALLLPDTDIVTLASYVLDRIAAVDENGQS